MFHTGVVVALSLYGLNKTEALAVAILLHGAQYVPVTLLGFYFLKKEHLKINADGEASLDQPDGEKSSAAKDTSEAINEA